MTKIDLSKDEIKAILRCLEPKGIFDCFISEMFEMEQLVYDIIGMSGTLVNYTDIGKIFKFVDKEYLNEKSFPLEKNYILAVNNSKKEFMFVNIGTGEVEYFDSDLDKLMENTLKEKYLVKIKNNESTYV